MTDSNTEFSDDPAGGEADRKGDDLLVGELISGRYRLESCLGEGGMGQVYRAEHVLMEKTVAIKVLHPDMTARDEVVARFQREARAAAALDHPNLCRALDFGQSEDGSFFFVMDYLEGESLREVIRTFGRLFPKRALGLGRQIAEALAEAHEKGIIHRDLKPDNVMIVDRDDGERAVVTDFGLVHLMASTEDGEEAPTRLTRTGVAYGTPHFMSPEQIAGDDIDARTDIYALGVVFFQMLTGEPPFDGGNLARVMGQHITEPVPRLEERTPEVSFPEGIQELIDRMMAKEPDDRPASAAEVVDAIDAIQRSLGPGGGPMPTARIGSARGGGAQAVPGRTERLKAAVRDLSPSERYAVLGVAALAALLLMSILCLTPFVFMSTMGDDADEDEPEAVAQPAEMESSEESEEPAGEEQPEELVGSTESAGDGDDADEVGGQDEPARSREAARGGEAPTEETAERRESTREAIERTIGEELPSAEEVRELFEVRESRPPGRGKGRGKGRSGRN